MIYYVSIQVFLNTTGLISHTYIYGHGGGFSGKARKKVFQTSEGLAASLSPELFRPSGVGFLDQITSDRVQTSLR